MILRTVPGLIRCLVMEGSRVNPRIISQGLAPPPYMKGETSASPVSFPCQPTANRGAGQAFQPPRNTGSQPGSCRLRCHVHWAAPHIYPAVQPKVRWVAVLKSYDCAVLPGLFALQFRLDPGLGGRLLLECVRGGEAEQPLGGPGGGGIDGQQRRGQVR